MKSTDRLQDEYCQRAGDRFPLKRFGKPDIVLGILIQHDEFGMGGLIQLGWIDLKRQIFPPSPSSYPSSSAISWFRFD